MRRGFTIHHNGPPARCVGQSHARCVQFWNGVRRYHMAPEPNGQGWSDIAYSFGVCPHGTVFVGRGWDKNQFANGKDLVPPNDGTDSEWYTILAFVGGGPGTVYNNEAPTSQMLSQIQSVISQGRNAKRCGFAVKPHKDFKQKPCPGVQLTGFCRQWDGKPFANVPAPTPSPVPTPEEETDMRIIDCQGKPAVIVFGDRTYKPLDTAERNAWRSAGVPAGLVTLPERDVILTSLEDTP
jgi:hypothetical protein